MADPPPPTYTNYPVSEPHAAPDEGPTDCHNVMTTTSDGPKGGTTVTMSPPMTEAKALSVIAAVYRGDSVEFITNDETCEVVQIGPREVIVRRDGFFGTSTTRIEIGRRRPR